MRKKLAIIALLILAGCEKKEQNQCQKEEAVLVGFYFSKSNNPFNGALEIFPCATNSDVYVGNYVNGQLSVINSSYIIVDGLISRTGVPLKLPLGNYRFVYWGVDKTPLPNSYSLSSGLTLNDRLDNEFWSLRKIPASTYYYPALNQVYAANEVTVGQTSINVDLSRKVAGVNIIIKNQDGTAFDSNIVSFDAIIGGVSPKINMNTGEADITNIVDVKIPIAIADDRFTASNLTAMLYPSVNAPTLTIVATLNDGSEAKFTTTLANKLVANGEQTVTISIDKILAGGGGLSGFSVNQWTTVSQEIGGVILD